MGRLGSEYQDPRDGDQAKSVQYGRLAFLTCVEEDAPQVLLGLRDDVLPRFAACPSGDDERWMPSAALDGEPVLQQWEHWAELSAFATAYQAWANKWGLTDHWLRRIVVSTLDHWRLVPELARFQGVGWGFWVHELNVPPCLPFRPTEETRKSFEARVAAWVRDNLAAAERLREDAGLTLSPEAPRARQGDVLLHFRWLVRYQCLRESYYDIANKSAGEGRDDSNVRKAVTKKADLIGLTLWK